MAALLAQRVHGAILIGIAAVTLLCWLTGIARAPDTFFVLLHRVRHRHQEGGPPV